MKSSDIKGGGTISENLDIIKKYVHKHGYADGITKILAKCSENAIHEEVKKEATEATGAYNKYKDNFFKLFLVSKHGLQNSDPIGLPKYCSEEIEKYVAYECFLGKMGSKAKGGILFDGQYAKSFWITGYSNDSTIPYNTEVTGGFATRILNGYRVNCSEVLAKRDFVTSASGFHECCKFYS